MGVYMEVNEKTCIFTAINYISDLEDCQKLRDEIDNRFNQNNIPYDVYLKLNQIIYNKEFSLRRKKDYENYKRKC